MINYFESGFLYSAENKIKRNLRKIFRAATSWRIRTGPRKRYVSYDELIKEEYLLPIDSVAGEDYGQITIEWSGLPVEIEVITETGEVIKWEQRE